MKIVAKAPAKINLSLDITGKKEDGYHTLQTVFQSLLADVRLLPIQCKEMDFLS